jgi:hypothetical protein
LEGWGVKIGRIYGTVFFRLNDSESSEKKILSDPVKQVCVYFAVLVSAGSFAVSIPPQHGPYYPHTPRDNTVSTCKNILNPP